MARLYPARGLRPTGDIDLYVKPNEGERAAQILREVIAAGWQVDLHADMRLMEDRSSDEIFRRAPLIDLDGEGIRVLSPEDQLRLVALHMMSHGAWRPLWLCDVAVMLEFLPGSFDWEYCLSGEMRRTNWVKCALKLSHEMLGSNISAVPDSVRRCNLPHWLMRTVLREWGRLVTPHGMRSPMSFELRHPLHLPRALKERWPNPIEGTFGRGNPFDESPRLPFQLKECVRRAAQFAAGPAKRIAGQAEFRGRE